VYVHDRSAAAVFGRIVSDIRSSIVVIVVCGGVIAMVLGFLWVLLLKSCTPCIVWTTIWLGFAVTTIVTLVAYYMAGVLVSDTLDAAVGAHDVLVAHAGEREGVNVADTERERVRETESVCVCVGESV
jgi:choline transporter-like protein 2/4/5